MSDIQEEYNIPFMEEQDNEGGADWPPSNQKFSAVGDFSDDEDENEEDEDDENEDDENENIDGEKKDSSSLELQNIIEEYSDEDSEEDSDDDENYQKIDEEIKKNFLREQHPESKNVNYEEVLALSKIVRDEEGNIIDNFHKTLPILTKYEKTRILGIRAKQISSGSKPFVNLDNKIILPYLIAEIELKTKKMPFIISRPMPNNTFEFWKIDDLEILE